MLFFTLFLFIFFSCNQIKQDSPESIGKTLFTILKENDSDGWNKIYRKSESSHAFFSDERNAMERHNRNFLWEEAEYLRTKFKGDKCHIIMRCRGYDYQFYFAARKHDDGNYYVYAL
jgi:hypothetical protein